MVEEARRLVGLAWPVVLGQLGMVLMSAVDLWMVAPLGEAATASLGLGNSYQFALVILGLGAATGIDPLVTRAYGAGRPQEAGAAAIRGMVLVGLLGVPLTALHLVAPTVLGALGQPPSLLPLADRYCTILAAGVPPLFAFAVIRQWLQGDGVMRPAMLTIVVGNVVNVVANAALVGPFGVAGIAGSTVAVRWIMLLGLVIMTAPTLRRSWPSRVTVSLGELAGVASLALPVAAQIGLEVWAFNAAALLAGLLGPTAVAAHVSALNLVAMAFMVASGLSAAAATRVGNLVGADRPWRTAGLASLLLVVGVMSCSGLAFFTFPQLFGRAYSADADVIALIAAVLPIGAAFGLFDGVQVVAFGVLRGLGDTRVPSLFNLVGYWALGLPLGALLLSTTELGLRGIWIGLAASLVVVSALLLVRIAWHARAASRFESADRPPIILDETAETVTQGTRIETLP